MASVFWHLLQIKERVMTTGTSLMLIAVGAVLAFAVNFQVVGINIVSIGAILIIVGIIGLIISVLTIIGYAPWSAGSGRSTAMASGAAPQPTSPQASVVVAAPAVAAAPATAAPAATPPPAR